MKKLYLALGLFGLASVAAAADPLNGTLWRAIDDKTGKPKAVVKFTEQNNGTLSASIQQVLTPGEENACSKCQGQYKNKSLKGLTIVHGLKNVGTNQYEGGSIMDPNSGKTYKLKSTLKGTQLDMHGFIGLTVIGRTQTWQRVQ